MFVLVGRTMIQICMCCGKLEWDDMEDFLEFCENEEDADLVLCKECFWDFEMPFAFDILGHRVLYFDDEDLEDFLEYWRELVS